MGYCIKLLEYDVTDCAPAKIILAKKTQWAKT
jgi:hypothetical protein